jgi:hypothetical protein
MTLFVGIGLIWIFLGDPLSNYTYAHGITRLVVYLFHHCSFCHIHRNAIDILCHLLRIFFWPRSHEWAPKNVFRSEDSSNIVPMLLNFSETPYTKIYTEPGGLTSFGRGGGGVYPFQLLTGSLKHRE